MEYKPMSCAMLFVIQVALQGCVVQNDAPALRDYPDARELDDWSIRSMSNRYVPTKGLEGISGRYVSFLLIAIDDMARNQSEKCGKDPLENHLYFFDEDDSTVTIIASTRIVPAPRDLDEQSGTIRAAVVPGSSFAKGCTVDYSIRKSDRKVMSIEFSPER